MFKKNNFKFPIIVGMIILAALSRLIFHPPNFTPIGAMALFGAAYFSKKYWAFLVPIIAMWLSDLFLNNVIYANMYPEYYTAFVWMGSLWVYASFILIVLLGMGVLKQVKWQNLLGASLGASVLFFLVTNFGVWIGSGMYPKTLTGLLSCYAAGIPFFWSTLAGDLFYTAVLFGAYELIQQKYFSVRTV